MKRNKKQIFLRWIDERQISISVLKIGPAKRLSVCAPKAIEDHFQWPALSCCPGDEKDRVCRNAKYCVRGIPPNHTRGQVYEEVSFWLQKKKVIKNEGKWLMTIWCCLLTFVFTHLLSHRLCVIDCFRGTGSWWKRQRNTKQEFNLRSSTASLLRPSGDGNDNGWDKCWKIQVRPLNDQLHVHAGLPEEAKESGGNQ